MKTFRALVSISAALGIGAATAGAQSFTSTGSNVAGGLDQSWTVSCVEVNGVWGNANCSSTATFASVVTASPGGWTGVPSGDARYISVMPSGSVGMSSGENARYEYTFATTFDAGLNPSSLTLTNFWFDNYWVGYRLNGGSIVSGGISPTPLPANGQNWTTPFAMDIGGLNAGMNTLEIIIQGNGATDGILVSGQITATPEPATFVLLGSGLAGVALIARRRKARAAE